MTSSTLRFYEDVGLLTADRTPSGYRMYDDAAVDRLEFISSAKAMGMTLDDIRDLLQVWQSGVCASARTQLAPLIDQRLVRRVLELPNPIGCTPRHYCHCDALFHLNYWHAVTFTQIHGWF